MDRLWLALLCFWRILTQQPLPVERLPSWAFPLAPPPIALPSIGSSARIPIATEAPPPAPLSKEKEKPKEKAPEAPAPAPAPAAAAAPAVDVTAVRDQGALLLLAHLQREGRLLDFLMEKIDAYQDAQVGAAVRQIHAGCKKAIADHLALESVLPGAEESSVTVDKGYDARAIRLVGNVKGQPPFKGTLKHHGWRAKPQKSFALTDGADATIVAPAEVEL